MLIGTIGSRMSLLPEVGEVTPLAGGNQRHKFLRSAGFSLTARNLLQSLLNFRIGELALSLDLT